MGALRYARERVEWCRDFYSEKLPGGRDPEGSTGTSMGVLRGGSWAYAAGFARSASRNEEGRYYKSPNVGFRIAAVPSAK